MFKKLAQKLNIKKEKSSSYTNMTSPYDEKSLFMSKLSKSALNLYEKHCDIKRFSQMVLSDLDNESDTKAVSELFKQGVVDPFEDEKLELLSDNTRFLKDLGLTD